MVNDTLVGLIGAVLIVGSMTVVIQALADEEGPSEGDQVDGPPPAVGTSTFSASGCQAFSAFWSPDVATLEPVVGPHWTPAEPTAPSRGLFWLFAYECPETSVNGLRQGGSNGAAALVAIETPSDERNVSAPDGWVAVPEWIGAAEAKSTEIMAKHGFNVTRGSGSVGVIESPLGDQVRAVIDTPDGSVEITSMVGGPAESRSVDGALVGVHPDTFSVFTGPEQMERRTAGQATVQTTGQTWVDTLGLEPVPSQVAYDTEMSWAFEVFDEPWDPSGNETANLHLS